MTNEANSETTDTNIIDLFTMSPIFQRHKLNTECYINYAHY